MKRILLLAALLLLSACAKELPPKPEILPPLPELDVNERVTYGAIKYEFQNFTISPTVVVLQPDGRCPRSYEHRGLIQTYDEVYGFIKGLSLAKRNDLFGFINTDGIPVVPLVYEQVIYRPDGKQQLVYASRQDKTVLLDLKNGCEWHYEPFRTEQKELYGNVITLPIEELCLVSGVLLVDQTPDRDGMIIPAMLLNGRIFDAYENSLYVGSYPARMRPGAYDSEIEYELVGQFGEGEYRVTFAVPKGVGKAVDGVQPIDPRSYQKTAETCLRENGFSDFQALTLSGIEGYLLPGKEKSALLEVRAAIDPPRQSKTARRIIALSAPAPNEGFVSALLFVPDVNAPGRAEVLGLYGQDAPNYDTLVGVYDFDKDGCAEIVKHRASYEQAEPVIDSLLDYRSAEN